MFKKNIVLLPPLFVQFSVTLQSEEQIAEECRASQIF
jgi:hypothetical protein